MFNFLRKRKIKKIANNALKYVAGHFIPPGQESVKQYSFRRDSVSNSSADNSEIKTSDNDKSTFSSGARFSLKTPKSEDPYNASEVAQLLRSNIEDENVANLMQILNKNVNPSFVDKLLFYINRKGVKDSDVYKAAQIDKRLFSKIVSDRQYKPSKDTAIALALALELSIDEAKDILSRAGYAFSHSSKRDIIIEYFFREKVYNLMDVNDVLYLLNQKIIGRT